MLKVFQIAWNDIKIEFSEKSTLIFFLILPIVFTVILGMSSDSNGDDMTDQRFTLLVVDEDRSSLSEHYRHMLEDSPVVRPVFLEAKEAQEHFDENQAAGLLTLPEGFEDELIQDRQVELTLVRAPGASQAFAIEEAVRASASRLGSAMAAAQASLEIFLQYRPQADINTQRSYLLEGFQQAQDLLAEPTVSIETTVGEEVSMDIATGAQQSSAGQLVTWTLITMLAASEVFVNERLGGTLRRLLSTPTRRSTILFGKITGRFSLGMLQMGLLIGFGMIVLGVEWGRSPAALVLVMVTFALAAVGLGVLLATFSRTRGQASGMTIFFSMLTAALGGAWWPLEVTPLAYQQAVKLLPTTWAMQGFNDVIVRGLGVSEILPEASMLVLFALVFFCVGLWRLKLE